MQRRLAAILAADVVGYSRLMEKDEAATHDAFKAHLTELIAPTVAAHGGHVMRLLGDSILVDFPSAVNAVRCAVDLQAGMGERNGEAADERRFLLRIGINIGDVIVDGNELFGDGVNIAVRLESLAEPGGIYISGSVHEHVERNLELSFKDLGEHNVKNIARPIRVFRVVTDATEREASRTPKPPEGPVLSAKPTIVVLPFINLSDDAEQQYFSDGISEDITTELSRFRTINVIARSTAFTYRGPSVDLRRVGRELGVQYAVEGSVRRVANRIRLTAQLVECASGNHLWAQRYDRTSEDLFAGQDDVIVQVVARVATQLTYERLNQAYRVPARNLQAYDYWLKANMLMEAWSAEADQQAIALLEKAIELDPHFARPYAGLAGIYNSRTLLSPGNPDDQSDRTRAFEYARKAVSLDPADARSHLNLAWSYMLAADFPAAERHFGHAGDLNPNDADIMIARGLGHAYLGDAQHGLRLARRAVELNPLHPDFYLANLASILFLAGAYEEAAATFERVPSVWPEVAAWCAAAYGQLGRMDAAERWAETFIRNVRSQWIGSPEATESDYVAWLVRANALRRPEDRELLLQGMEGAGLPRPPRMHSAQRQPPIMTTPSSRL